jgi:hypothetical protein
VPDPQDGITRIVVRRRRTRRHRRHRIVRRCLALIVFAVVVTAVAALTSQYLIPSLFQSHPRVVHVQAALSLSSPTPALDQILSQAASEPRTVYPYSVVPGGVADAKELKWIAEHDPVVAAHYAGFDYAHAMIVRLTLARTVYVSYRIGNHIYWTSHRVTLHKGEKLLTDGRMTARTRCANRVEETPQQQQAEATEPTEEKLDQPVRSGQGTAVQAPPVNFQSVLSSRAQTPSLGAMGPLAPYNPFVGGNFVSVAVPPLPEGLCTPITKKKPGAEIATGLGKKKKIIGPCGNEGGGTGTVPEPGTWVLFGSGLALIAWRFRHRFATT